MRWAWHGVLCAILMVAGVATGAPGADLERLLPTELDRFFAWAEELEAFLTSVDYARLEEKIFVQQNKEIEPLFLAGQFPEEALFLLPVKPRGQSLQLA